MPRIRTIKPEFWTAAQVLELSRDARLLFIGMWNFCDDRGVHPAAIKTLKAEVFPGDDLTTDEVAGLVEELIDQGLIREYSVSTHGALTERSCDRKKWWHVTGWHHQLINRPSKSRYPEPPCDNAPLPSDENGADDETQRRAPKGNGNATTHKGKIDAPEPENHGALSEHSVSTHGALTTGKEGKGKERKKTYCSSRDERFETFWQAYPRKIGKGHAKRAWEKLKPDEHLLGRMVAAVERAKKSEQWMRDGGQYIPYPATWLNREGWEDEIEPAKPKSSKPSNSRQWDLDNLPENVRLNAAGDDIERNPDGSPVFYIPRGQYA